jgi:hypothetical protein
LWQRMIAFVRPSGRFEIDDFPGIDGLDVDSVARQQESSVLGLSPVKLIDYKHDPYPKWSAESRANGTANCQLGTTKNNRVIECGARTDQGRYQADAQSLMVSASLRRKGHCCDQRVLRAGPATIARGLDMENVFVIIKRLPPFRVE